MILAPEITLTKTIVFVTHTEKYVLCSFKEHNEKFRSVIKSNGYEWSDSSKAWRRVINPETNGKPEDRAAEITSSLVSSGFSVDVPEHIAVIVQSGDWTKEQRLWVMAFDGKFGLRWRGLNDNLYVRSHLLPESRWDTTHKCVIVPALYFSEVIGFADEHGFDFTKKALELLEKAKNEYTQTVLSSIPSPKETVTEKPKYQSAKIDFSDASYHHLSTLTSLMPHQLPAVTKMQSSRIGALFMDMGTGKTRCAIELAYIRQQRISKVIWFCPVSLKLTIEAEIRKHSIGEDICVFDETIDDMNFPSVFWYIVGIESMSSSDRTILTVNKVIDENSFVIVDESSYIKGHASKRSMRITELAKRAKYRLLLTGTPISQGIEDLYSQMRFLSTSILGYGSFYSFARNHLEYSEKYPGLIVRSHGISNISGKIEPFVYQITKDECIDLPDKIYDTIYCSLTEQQSEYYQQAKEEILLNVEEPSSYIIFQLFTALQQIVSGFWNRNGNTMEIKNERVNALDVAIQSIPVEEKVIIWCKYIYSVQKISQKLSNCALYYGELSEQERASQLDKFLNSDCRFLVATQATGGHGLTLNEAHYHIFYENEFKYSHRIQAEDRSHRIGQTKPVTYIDIISSSGIDNRIQKSLAKKENVVSSFRNEINKNKVKDI